MSYSALIRRSLCSSVQSHLVSRTFASSARRDEHFLNVDTDGFERAVSKDRAKGKVVLVDFYADWCGPCKMLSPILEKLTKDESMQSGSGRSLDLVTVDTDTQIQLAKEYNVISIFLYLLAVVSFSFSFPFQIRSLPTVIAFRDGKPISQFMGALPETGVMNFLKSV